MRIAFLGTPDFAVPSLRRLVTDGHELPLVVTQPDRPAGRGRNPAPPPIKRAAEELGLAVYQPIRVRRAQALDVIRQARPELLVTAAFGQILPQELLDMAPRGALNVHASLLPAYRGAAPIHRAVMDGQAMTGITIMWMDAGLDTGDILLQRQLPIGPDEDAGSVHDRLARLGAEALSEAVALIAAGRAPRIPQDESQATYAHKLERSDEWLDWTLSAQIVHNRVRGLNPWPGASTGLARRPFKIRRTRLAAQGYPPARPGSIVALSPDGRPVVACGSGHLEIDEAQPPGKRSMDGRSLVNGRYIKVGDAFDAVPLHEAGREA